jgi:glycosyltransferase involved in cell wall biosynthesis
VVIPNFNGSLYIGKAISSVLDQTYKNIEIIVVDDGSTDSSVELIRNYGTNVRLLLKENQGASSARNTGIKAASGDFIALLDADDYWNVDKIEKQMIKFEDSETILVYCSSQIVSDNPGSNKILKAMYKGDCYSYFIRNPSKAIVIAGCSSAVIRSSAINMSGDFDEDFRGPAEDWDFFRRLSKLGKFDFVDEPLASYRLHGENLSAKSRSDYFNGNLKALEKILFEDLTLRRSTYGAMLLRFYFQSLKTAISFKDRYLLLNILKSRTFSTKFYRRHRN